MMTCLAARRVRLGAAIDSDSRPLLMRLIFARQRWLGAQCDPGTLGQNQMFGDRPSVGQKSDGIRFSVEHRRKGSDLLESDGVGLEDIDADSCCQQDGDDLSAGGSALGRDAGCAFETVRIFPAIGIQFQRHVLWCQELDITTTGARQLYRCHSHPFAVTFVIAANSDCVTPLLRNMAAVHDW